MKYLKLYEESQDAPPDKNNSMLFIKLENFLKELIKNFQFTKIVHNNMGHRNKNKGIFETDLYYKEISIFAIYLNQSTKSERVNIFYSDELSPLSDEMESLEGYIYNELIGIKGVSYSSESGVSCVVYSDNDYSGVKFSTDDYLLFHQAKKYNL